MIAQLRDVKVRRGTRSSSLFLRMLLRATMFRRGRTASALLAIVVAAAAATAALNLFVDMQAKLTREFRNYGANVAIVAPPAELLPQDVLPIVESALNGRGYAAPFAYVVAHASNGTPVVVSGTDFARARKLNAWWQVAKWPDGPNEALLGIKAASLVSSDGKPFDLSFEGHTIRLNPVGTLQTGAAEDSRIYIPLSEFTAWTGVAPSTVEVAVSGSAREINTAIAKLRDALPRAEVRPVRQIIEGEARVFGKMRSTLLAASAIIIVTAALCVLATLLGWVSDRRRDFAIMKALGASQGLINSFFAGEAAILGAVGGVLGFLIGVQIAIWIGRVNFHAAVAPRLAIFPIILSGSMAVALVAAITPIFLLGRLQPATILRGE
ncbi:MAG: FtsX-like permease family protein [Acidobacteriales bacterium]|nr:FtsX-like permease family protein [Terriglobales bacterium]